MNRIVAGKAEPFFEALPAPCRRTVRAGRVRRRRRRAVENSARARLAAGDRVSPSPSRDCSALRPITSLPDGPLCARHACRRLLGCSPSRASILFAEFGRASEARPGDAPSGARARRGGLRAGAAVRRLERSVDPQGIRDPRRRVLARSRCCISFSRSARSPWRWRSACRSAWLIARKTGWRAPVLNTLNAIQTIPSIALFGILIGPLGWISGPCARRRGARCPRRRRRAGDARALSLFVAADGGQHGRRPRRRRRATSSTPPTAWA